MTTPTTPTARALLAVLRTERDRWADTADDDTQNTFMRHGATSRRDQLDFVLQALGRDLPAIEDQAVEMAERSAAWLDAGAGVAVR